MTAKAALHFEKPYEFLRRWTAKRDGWQYDVLSTKHNEWTALATDPNGTITVLERAVETSADARDVCQQHAKENLICQSH